MPVTILEIANAVKPIEKEDRYLAAFIFELHDPFIKVIVNSENCTSLNHINIGGAVIGISFVSLSQFESGQKDRMLKNRRASMLDNAHIIFDKRGILLPLQEKYKAGKPDTPLAHDYHEIRFSVLHADNKINYALENGDEVSAQMGFHVAINGLLKAHYQINSRWFVNDKWITKDLQQWDPVLLSLLSSFLWPVSPAEKNDSWKQMIEHVLAPIGGRLDHIGNNCNCASCGADLGLLM